MFLFRTFTEKISRKVTSEFIKNRASEKFTLDVGCGESPYSKYFPNRVSFDLEYTEGANLIADVNDLPFKNESFEQILCSEVLEHLEVPERGVKEMERVLKKNGKLIITTRFLFPLHNEPQDFWRFTKFGLEKMFKGWKIEKLEGDTGDLMSLASVMQRFAFRQKNYIKVLFLLLCKLIYMLNLIFRNRVKTKIMPTGYLLIVRKG